MLELRRYPRIACDRAGTLVFESAGDEVALDVQVSSVSCQGAGIEAERADVARVSPGSRVQLSTDIDGRAMQIPARVVWAAGSHVGLRLLLGSLGDDDREAYASWIVPLTNKAIVAARG